MNTIANEEEGWTVNENEKDTTKNHVQTSNTKNIMTKMFILLTVCIIWQNTMCNWTHHKFEDLFQNSSTSFQSKISLLRKCKATISFNTEQ